MTRNPDRIPELLEAIEERWKKDPDLRLGQLLSILSQKSYYNPSLFTIEDDEMMLNMGKEFDCNYLTEENDDVK